MLLISLLAVAALACTTAYQVSAVECPAADSYPSEVNRIA